MSMLITLVVNCLGLGLIGLIVWWFWMSKDTPESR